MMYIRFTTFLQIQHSNGSVGASQGHKNVLRTDGHLDWEEGLNLDRPQHLQGITILRKPQQIILGECDYLETVLREREVGYLFISLYMCVV